MKRLTAIILVILLIGGLTGCSHNNANESESHETAQESAAVRESAAEKESLEARESGAEQETAREEPSDTDAKDERSEDEASGDESAEEDQTTEPEKTPVDLLLVNASAELEEESKEYTGKEIVQDGSVVVTAMIDGKETELTQDQDYTVSYQDNIHAGTATMIIEGMGDYTGRIEKTFEIVLPVYETEYFSFTMPEFWIDEGVTAELKEYDRFPPEQFTEEEGRPLGNVLYLYCNGLPVGEVSACLTKAYMCGQQFVRFVASKENLKGGITVVMAGYNYMQEYLYDINNEFGHNENCKSVLLPDEEKEELYYVTTGTPISMEEVLQMDEKDLIPNSENNPVTAFFEENIVPCLRTKKLDVLEYEKGPWQEAYYDLLLNKMDDYTCYRLVYIDDDTVPELAAWTEGTTFASHADIYSYNENGAFLLGEAGGSSYGHMTYYPGTGVIQNNFGPHMGMHKFGLAFLKDGNLVRAIQIGLDEGYRDKTTISLNLFGTEKEITMDEYDELKDLMTQAIKSLGKHDIYRADNELELSTLTMDEIGMIMEDPDSLFDNPNPLRKDVDAAKILEPSLLRAGEIMGMDITDYLS